MPLDFDRLIIAGVAILLTIVVQSFVQKRAINKAVQRYWNEKVEDSPKLVHQDVGAIVDRLGITNVLIAAILAVLIFR